MGIRDIYKAGSTDVVDLSCFDAADFGTLLATLTRSYVRGVQLVDLVNEVPIQLNEHHALDLTCKHVAVQVTNEVGEP